MSVNTILTIDTYLSIYSSTTTRHLAYMLTKSDLAAIHTYPVAIQMSRTPAQFEGVVPILYTDVFARSSVVEYDRIVGAIDRAGIVKLVLPHFQLCKKIARHCRLNRDLSTQVSCWIYVKDTSHALVPWMEQHLLDWTDDYGVWMQRQIPRQFW